MHPVQQEEVGHLTVSGLRQVATRAGTETLRALSRRKEEIGVAGAAAVIGGASPYLVAIPAVKVLGFTSAGIAAKSLAASMMSSAAIANGGGVAASGTVAVCQSVGATFSIAAVGQPLLIVGALAGAGAAAGYGGYKLYQAMKKPHQQHLARL